MQFRGVVNSMMLFRHMLVLVILAWGCGSVIAGPPQVELDTLFAKLHDPATGAQVLSIEPQIWDAWMHGGTDAENEQLAKATQSMNLGAFALAEQQFTAMLATSPNYAEVWNKRATLYYLMGRMDDSLNDIKKTLDLEPRHFGALSGRGMIYQRMGKNPEALAAFKEALSINPKMPGPRLAVQELEKLLPEL
jgi:tetratricopeptide (TPR) repeat protein